MPKKIRLVAILIIACLIPTAAAQAYYSSISGELRDSTTSALWTHGASVELFNCNTLATISIVPVDASGTFNIDISTLVTTTTPLCVNVTFAAGGNGTPGSAAKGPYPDRTASSGTLNTGVYFTGTGPNVITLSELSAASHAETGGLWVGLVAALGLLVLGGWIWRRRAMPS